MTSPGDSVQNPLPVDTKKVEPKVFWSTVGSYVGGVVALTLVNVFTANQNELLFAALPDPIETFVLPFVPGIVAAVAGFSARHQWRSSGGNVG
jgi:hypothetical protein